MKIITFQGGLGNQIFQYAYYQYLRKHNPGQTFYGFYPSTALKGHNGLEIDKWFDVELPKSTWLSDAIAYVLFGVNKVFWKLKKPHPFTDTDWFRKPDALFYSGYWQDKKYFLDVCLPCFKNNLPLGKENEQYLWKIQQSNAVAVHVRRGDYTDPKLQYIYGNICTVEYYVRAIAEMEKRLENPVFFFFSDDPGYVEKHFGGIEKTVISCNTGENSFFDMFLMAQCKGLVIANSTFSCWAAYLNKNNPLVICPPKWRNDKPSPPVVLDSWIRLD